jgi:hypothetical protein
LLVGVNKREAFWETIRRDASRNMLDCYDIRLEEIVNSFTNVTKKYWKNQRGIAARKKRTMRFKSDIFRNRRTEKSFGWEKFGAREGSFAKKVLYYVREEMLRGAGNRLEGEKWEETLLYAIASNGDFFGTGIMGLSEKKLYKKFFKTIEIPPIAKVDVELIKDIEFYSKFLAIFASKMKKDWARIDNEMNGKGMKKAQENYEQKNIVKWAEETEKNKRHMIKHPDDDDSIQDGMSLTQRELYKEKIQKRKKMINL